MPVEALGGGVGVYVALGIAFLLGLLILRFIIGVAISIIKKVLAVAIILAIIWFGANALGIPLPI